jgi:hypothetical protein
VNNGIICDIGVENSSKPVFTSRRMERQWQRMQGVKMLRAGIPAHKHQPIWLQHRIRPKKQGKIL